MTPSLPCLPASLALWPPGRPAIYIYIYIYIWTGPGESVPIHIRYGTILFLRGDIVHCGGVPKDFYCKGKKYPRLHFYFLTSAADHPNNSIFHESFDGVPFDKDHYHPWDP
jgi:hypothetical protein